jgi:hypothetical protein
LSFGEFGRRQETLDASGFVLGGGAGAAAGATGAAHHLPEQREPRCRLPRPVDELLLEAVHLLVVLPLPRHAPGLPDRRRDPAHVVVDRGETAAGRHPLDDDEPAEGFDENGLAIGIAQGEEIA